jgi:inosose dehydratase
VPGWGVQLPPDRVLAEIRGLGISHVEAGPLGYLGGDATAIRSLLDRHGLSLVGGFVPVALHDAEQLADTFAAVRAVAELYAEAGAHVLVSAGVVDLDWSPRIELDETSWRTFCDALSRLDQLAGECNLVHVLHPHVGTLIERSEDVERVLERSDVRLCLDTGHLTLGGADPAVLARDAPERIGHVHLKDVRSGPAADLRDGRTTLVEATRRGLFAPLGDGQARVAETVRALEQTGYAGWYVLEQDTMLTGDAAFAPGTGPTADARRSLVYLETLLDDDQPVVSSGGREVGRKAS